MISHNHKVYNIQWLKSNSNAVYLYSNNIFDICKFSGHTYYIEQQKEHSTCPHCRPSATSILTQDQSGQQTNDDKQKFDMKYSAQGHQKRHQPRKKGEQYPKPLCEIPSLQQQKAQNKGEYVQKLSYQKQHSFVQGGARPKEWSKHVSKSHCSQDKVSYPAVPMQYATKNEKVGKQRQQCARQIDKKSKDEGHDYNTETSSTTKAPGKRIKRKRPRKK